jgi:hypothetical protein
MSTHVNAFYLNFDFDFDFGHSAAGASCHSVGRRRRARGERTIDRPMTVGKFSTGGRQGCDFV